MGLAFQRADVRQKQGCLGKTETGLRQPYMLAREGGAHQTSGNRQTFLSRRWVQCALTWNSNAPLSVFCTCMEGRYGFSVLGPHRKWGGGAALELITGPLWASLLYDVIMVNTHPELSDILCILEI